MWNKDICKKCVNERSDTDPLHPECWSEIDENQWNETGRVWCQQEGGSGIYRNMHFEVPKCCLFFMEQWMHHEMFEEW